MRITYILNNIYNNIIPIWVLNIHPADLDDEETRKVICIVLYSLYTIYEVRFVFIYLYR